MTPSIRPVRVMVVDDSAVIRGLWARVLDAEPDLRVVASAWNGRAALDVLRRKEVDVVLLDVEMPEMDGLEALPRILREHPKVRVVMVSSLTARGAEVTLRALSLGAADYVTKPSASRGAGEREAVSAELVRKVRALGRRITGGAQGRDAVPPPAWPRAHPGGGPTHPTGSPWTPTAGKRPTAPPQVVGIASSTGGPNALTTLLGDLPVDFPIPILVVQHMPALFTAMLADRLDRVGDRPCAEARDGEEVQPGHTYVAPGEKHLTVAGERGRIVLRLSDGPPENFCKPSADPLFRSLAEVCGAAALGVVLTGMGQDGLAGVRDLSRAAARIIVQDEETSVVWGMPGAVARAGLADDVLPLGRIAREISEHVRAPR